METGFLSKRSPFAVVTTHDKAICNNSVGKQSRLPSVPQALFGFQLIEWIAAKSRLPAFKCRHRLAVAARFSRRSSYIFSQEKTTFQGCGESMTIWEVLHTLSKSMHLCALFIVNGPNSRNFRLSWKAWKRCA